MQTQLSQRTPRMRVRDDGCEVAVACLACPLPACKYEFQGGLREMANKARDAEIVALRAAGVDAVVIAARVRISKRTVWRVLQGAGVTA